MFALMPRPASPLPLALTAALLLGLAPVGDAVAQEAPVAEPVAEALEVTEAVPDATEAPAEVAEAEVAATEEPTATPEAEAEPSPEDAAPEPAVEPAVEPAAESPAEAEEPTVEAEEPAELVPDEASEIVSDTVDAAEEVAEDATDATEEIAEDAEQLIEETATDWSGLIERAPQFFAYTHHAAVHLPIALWLFGALFVVVGLFAPSVRMQIPLACLVGGAATSVAAVLSGWWYAEFEWGADWKEIDWSELIVQHRWAGVALAAVSLVLSLIALVNLSARSRFWGFVWRAGLIALALAVAWEGHIGGEMIHGEGFLEEAYEAWVNPAAE